MLQQPERENLHNMLNHGVCNVRIGNDIHKYNFWEGDVQVYVDGSFSQNPEVFSFEKHENEIEDYRHYLSCCLSQFKVEIGSINLSIPESKFKEYISDVTKELGEHIKKRKAFCKKNSDTTDSSKKEDIERYNTEFELIDVFIKEINVMCKPANEDEVSESRKEKKGKKTDPINEQNKAKDISSAQPVSDYQPSPIIILTWNSKVEILKRIFKYLVTEPYNDRLPVILASEEDINEFILHRFHIFNNIPEILDDKKNEKQFKFKLNCNVNIFADIFYQLSQKIVNKKTTALANTTDEIAYFIIQNFTAKEGGEISYSTLLKYLRPGSDRRPKELDPNKIPVDRLFRI
ncbi:MAG: hypothetical protein HY063_00460 [Bacteroidetes bacterium]|nr:hypothetical protein [Bacteroidota bacterium]